MKDKVYKIVLLISVGLLLTVITGCSSSEEASVEVVENAISIKAMEVGLSDNELTKSFTGTLEGEKQAVITGKISEAVEKISVSEGDRVKVNDVLVGLDRSGATSSYIQTQSLYKNAEKNYKKMEYL